MCYLWVVIPKLNPMKRVLFFVALVATAAAILCGVLLRRSYATIRRLEHNQEALLGDVEYYRTSFEHSAASVAVLELRVDELRRLREDDAREIRSLGIRLRRAESYAKSVVQTRSQAAILLRDTVILHDTVRLFDATVGHTSLSGHIANDSLMVDIHQRDTIYQVVHHVPRKFLFFRWGTKAIHQDVWTSNPNSEIVYTEYIELSKPERASRRRSRGRK